MWYDLEMKKRIELNDPTGHKFLQQQLKGRQEEDKKLAQVVWDVLHVQVGHH